MAAIGQALNFLSSPNFLPPNSLHMVQVVSTVLNYRSEEEEMCIAKHERIKVWVQEEEAMNNQRRNGVVNEEGGIEHLNL